MRLLLIDANYFSYFPSFPSEISTVHSKEGNKKKEDYTNCLVVNVAIESRDTAKTVSNATINIKELATEFNVKHIVLLPNVHLTETPARAKKALRLLQDLHKRLDNNKVFLVHLEAFGFSGEWKITSKKHLKSVLGRRYT